MVDRQEARILLVEDEPGDASLVRQALRGQGRFRVDWATSLAEARPFLANGGPDLVLLDLSLPDSTGLDTVRALRAATMAPVIVLTGNEDAALALETLDAGAQDYLVKGEIQADALARAIRHALTRARLEQRLRDSEARMALALAGAGLGLWDWRVATGEVTFDERWAGMLGHALEEIEPRVSSWEERVHPDDWPTIRAALQPHLDGATPFYQCEHRMRHRDGHWVWILDAGRVIERDGEGRPLRAVGIHQDISDRKHAELELAREAEERRELLAALGEGVYGVGPDGRCAFVNPAAMAMLGYPEAELIGADIHALIHHSHPGGEPYAHADCPIHRTLRDGQPRRQEDWYWRHDGVVMPVDMTVTPLHRDDGIGGVVVVFRDISERRAAQARDRLLVSALEAVANAIVITDPTARVEWVNPAFERLTGYRHDEAIGRRPAELVKSGRQDKAFYEALWSTILAGQTWRGEVINRRKDGSLYDEELTIAPVRDESGEIRHFVGVKQDISERKRLEAELIELATTDALTGLANRRQFLDRMRLEFDRMKRYEGPPTTLLMLDLDHFKHVNDRHGHAVGDRVLRHFAELLRASQRRTDLAGRLGGEEFALLLPGTGIDSARQLAERLRERVAASPAPGDGGDVGLTVSVGVASLRASDTSPDDALKRADGAMYRAKAAGRDRVEIETSQDRDASD